MMCKKCSGLTAGLVLGLGVLMLLKDLAVWNFWGINCWTGLLLIVGVAKFGYMKCPDCKKCKA